MKIVGRQRAAVQIDLTPLVDVVFILLVFVLLAASFSRQPAVAVALPHADGARPVTSEALVVTIERDGGTWLDGAKISAKALPSALKQRRAAHQALLVRADGAVALERAVLVLDAGRSAGFAQLSIATQRHPAERSAQ